MQCKPTQIIIMADAFFDINIVDGEIFTLLPKQLKRAVVNSTNQIGRVVNKDVTTKIKKEYAIPARVTKVGRDIFLVKAREDKITFTIIIKDASRGLFKFKHRQDESGLNVQVTKGKIRKVKGGFIAPISKNNRNKFAFVRDKKRRITRFTKKGKPYQADARIFLFGLNLKNLYASKISLKNIENIIGKKYQKLFDAAFDKQFFK